MTTLLNRISNRKFLLAVAAVTVVSLITGAGALRAGSVTAQAPELDQNWAAQNWVTAWGASPVVGSVIPGNSCPAGTGLTNQTVRNVVFASAGGDAVRIRLTNTFGTQAMLVGHASVAVQSSGATAVPGTVRQLTFGGQTSVTLAAGADALSDPVAMHIAPLSVLLVSVYVPGPTGPVTNHPFTAQGNYLASGDLTQAAGATGYGDTPCWMLIDGVDVGASQQVTGSVVALGDSITDTANTTGNANRRWPDDLARRLNALHGPTLSVVNAGLGGNRLLAPRDGQPYYGIPALARLDHDVFTQTGVRSVILLEGVNDIGFSATVGQIISADEQVIAQAHARGLRIFGATITPFGGSIISSAANEQTREAVNNWIMTSNAFDGVIDFASAVAGSADPTTLNPAFDSGDHLHPNDAGCQAMANAINLRMLLDQR
ncbi:MAG TPA: SGNH/GDSL hydrolase family protein [Streptosporangiaceae bacterium]